MVRAGAPAVGPPDSGRVRDSVGDVGDEVVHLPFRHDENAHRQLLTAAITSGIDDAYVPFLAADLLQGWIATPTWEDSRAFLDRHHSVLASGTVRAVLDALVAANPDRADLLAHRCLLTAATAGHTDDAFALATGTRPAHRTQILRTVRRPRPASAARRPRPPRGHGRHQPSRPR